MSFPATRAHVPSSPGRKLAVRGCVNAYFPPAWTEFSDLVEQPLSEPYMTNVDPVRGTHDAILTRSTNQEIWWNRQQARWTYIVHFVGPCRTFEWINAQLQSKRTANVWMCVGNLPCDGRSGKLKSDLQGSMGIPNQSTTG